MNELNPQGQPLDPNQKPNQNPGQGAPNQEQQPAPMPGQGEPAGQPQVPPPPAPTEVPPPPPTAEEKVGIRTMNEDVSSMESSGGTPQEPKTFRPKELLGKEPVFEPNQQNPASSPQGPQKKGGKLLVFSLVGLVVLGGLGAAAYFFLPGLLTQSEPEPLPLPVVSLTAEPGAIEEGQASTLSWSVTEAESASIEGIGDVELSGTREVVPQETTTYRLSAVGPGGTAESSATVTVTVPAPPPPPPFEHTSLFSSEAAVAQVQIAPSELTAASFIAAINSALESETAPVSVEITPMNSEGTSMSAYDVAPLFLPALSAEYLTATIAEDFTVFAYKNSGGVWPGFIFEVNKNEAGESADISPLTTLVEESPEIFHVSDPGTPAADEFQDRTDISEISDNIQSARYLLFPDPGVSFNIAVFNRGDSEYVILSTSFTGFKEIVRLLEL